MIILTCMCSESDFHFENYRDCRCLNFIINLTFSNSFQKEKTKRLDKNGNSAIEISKNWANCRIRGSKIVLCWKFGKISKHFKHFINERPNMRLNIFVPNLLEKGNIFYNLLFTCSLTSDRQKNLIDQSFIWRRD